MTNDTVTHTHKYPWSGSQIATVVISVGLAAGFALFMWSASGKAGWLALLVFAPIAGFLAWRKNTTRKKASEVRVSITGGVLTVESDMNDRPRVTLPLKGLDGVGLRDFDGREGIILNAADEDGKETSIRVPARVFTPGNPIGPAIIEAAKANRVTISKSAREVLGA